MDQHETSRYPASYVDWANYAACPSGTWSCGAEAGKPCWDRRSSANDASRAWYPRLTKNRPCKGRKRTKSKVRAQVEHVAGGGQA